jgi:hypothetical protein
MQKRALPLPLNLQRTTVRHRQLALLPLSDRCAPPIIHGFSLVPDDTDRTMGLASSHIF